MLQADLANIFADTSLTVPVSFGSPAQTPRGFLSTEDVPESDGQGGVIVVQRRVLTVAAGALSGLANDLPITVDGVAYVIHDERSAGQGKRKIILAEDR